MVIAQQDSASTLYAVERIKPGIYTLCRLRDWVALEDFEVAPRISKKLLSRHSQREDYTGDVWWKTAAVDIDHEDPQRYQETQKTKHCTKMRLSMKLPSCPILETETSEKHLSVKDASTLHEATCLETNPSAVPIGDDNSTGIEDVLGLVRTQYLESLYITKVRAIVTLVLEPID